MRILYYALQWTWGISQNILGSLFALFMIRKPHFMYRNAVVTQWNFSGSMGLGMFIFLGKPLWKEASIEQIRRSEARILVHEYGHTIQSVILGPFYLFVIGIPSLIWANLPLLRRYRQKKKKSYYSMYQERWANHLGSKATHEPAPEQKV